RFLAFPPLAPFNWETILGIGVATFVGGALPDIDNVASKVWKFNLTPWEDDMTRNSLEGHRNLFHSIIGLAIFTFSLGWLLTLVKLANLDIYHIQQAFALGYLSHLISDSLTRNGVPWFYPIDIHLGFPPFKSLRMKTGGFWEKIVVLPLLLIITIWILFIYRFNLHLLFSNQ
ncbi:MAG: metal-dependent hydrolase, partial [Patescibacteria group bacterium]